MKVRKIQNEISFPSFQEKRKKENRDKKNRDSKTKRETERKEMKGRLREVEWDY